MICFGIYGVYIYVSKHKFDKKCMIFKWFSLIFVEIFHDLAWFFVTRIRTTTWNHITLNDLFIYVVVVYQCSISNLMVIGDFEALL